MKINESQWLGLIGTFLFGSIIIKYYFLTPLWEQPAFEMGEFSSFLCMILIFSLLSLSIVYFIVPFIDSYKNDEITIDVKRFDTELIEINKKLDLILKNK
jgi:hypothetical protein